MQLRKAILALLNPYLLTMAFRMKRFRLFSIDIKGIKAGSMTEFRATP